MLGPTSHKMRTRRSVRVMCITLSPLHPMLPAQGGFPSQAQPVALPGLHAHIHTVHHSSACARSHLCLNRQAVPLQSPARAGPRASHATQHPQPLQSSPCLHVLECCAPARAGKRRRKKGKKGGDSDSDAVMEGERSESDAPSPAADKAAERERKVGGPWWLLVSCGTRDGGGCEAEEVQQQLGSCTSACLKTVWGFVIWSQARRTPICTMSTSQLCAQMPSCIAPLPAQEPSHVHVTQQSNAAWIKLIDTHNQLHITRPCTKPTAAC